MSDAPETGSRRHFRLSVYIFTFYEGVLVQPKDNRPIPMPSPLNYPAYIVLAYENLVVRTRVSWMVNFRDFVVFSNTGVQALCNVVGIICLPSLGWNRVN